MTTVIKPYTPINCAFHDYLEHFATLGKLVAIVYTDHRTSEIETIEKAIITDLTGGRNGEYSHIEFDNQEVIIRNDFLISVGGIKVADFDKGKCDI
ncbi:MAG: hypothetical protein AB8B74_10770 [Crocinitomicaceae bacterium]